VAQHHCVPARTTNRTVAHVTRQTEQNGKDLEKMSMSLISEPSDLIPAVAVAGKPPEMLQFRLVFGKQVKRRRNPAGPGRSERSRRGAAGTIAREILVSDAPNVHFDLSRTNILPYPGHAESIRIDAATKNYPFQGVSLFSDQ
jgi:hypothetical protein